MWHRRLPRKEDGGDETPTPTPPADDDPNDPAQPLTSTTATPTPPEGATVSADTVSTASTTDPTDSTAGDGDTPPMPEDYDKKMIRYEEELAEMEKCLACYAKQFNQMKQLLAQKRAEEAARAVASAVTFVYPAQRQPHPLPTLTLNGRPIATPNRSFARNAAAQPRPTNLFGTTQNQATNVNSNAVPYVGPTPAKVAKGPTNACWFTSGFPEGWWPFSGLPGAGTTSSRNGFQTRIQGGGVGSRVTFRQKFWTCSNCTRTDISAHGTASISIGGNGGEITATLDIAFDPSHEIEILPRYDASGRMASVSVGRVGQLPFILTFGRDCLLENGTFVLRIPSLFGGSTGGRDELELTFTRRGDVVEITGKFMKVGVVQDVTGSRITVKMISGRTHVEVKAANM